ncbi:MAG: ABC transporter ATP-binding protein [Thermoanaerobaculia bacterium]
MSSLSFRTGAAIEAERLSKRYRITGAREGEYKTLRDGLTGLFSLRSWRSSAREDVWALKDVSFEVKEGEAFGIVGRNGAGKSTLLKILSRITEPTGGMARIRGRVASLLEVGTGFHPELTGRENVFLNGAILGMTRAEIKSKFDEIVAFAEVEKFIDTPVKRYSSGMYVRLAFAVAAHLEPEILLVDEVLAVGDVTFQRRCLGKMGEVSRSGRTVLFVSHNMQAVRTLCGSALWLDGGAARACGTSQAIVEEYLTYQREAWKDSEIADQISVLEEDPLFRLVDAAVVQGGERTLSVVSGEPVVFEMEYEVRSRTDGLHVYLRFFDLDGTLLFETLHNGDGETLPVVEPGTFDSRVAIPADFLAAGSYIVEFNAGTMGGRFVMSRPVRVRLQVELSGRVNRAYSGYGTHGKIAPLLRWETEIRGNSMTATGRT